MKNLIFLILLFPFVIVCQNSTLPVVRAKDYSSSNMTYQPPVRVEVDGVQPNTYNRTVVKNAQPETLDASFENILVDKLISNKKKYKHILIEKVIGWQVGSNYETIRDNIVNSGKYNLLNVEEISTNKINKQKIFKPNIVNSAYLTNPEVLILEWARESNGINKTTRLTLRDYNGETIYEAEYKNKTFLEMLRPINSNYQMSKKQAKENIIGLKELFDLGIINKEEYDEGTQKLKKILLD